MKSIALLLAALTVSLSASAEPVPKGVEAAIKNLSLQSWSFKDGSLRLVMNQRLVSKQFYSTAVHLVCGEQFQEPEAFKRMGLQRIEVMNHVDAQGFALVDADAQCRKLGQAKGDAAEALIQASAQSCEAGVCRAR